MLTSESFPLSTLGTWVEVSALGPRGVVGMVWIRDGHACGSLLGGPVG